MNSKKNWTQTTWDSIIDTVWQFSTETTFGWLWCGSFCHAPNAKPAKPESGRNHVRTRKGCLKQDEFPSTKELLSFHDSRTNIAKSNHNSREQESSQPYHGDGTCSFLRTRSKLNWKRAPFLRLLRPQYRSSSARPCTGVQVFIGSKVQCLFCFETCAAEGKKREGMQILK